MKFLKDLKNLKERRALVRVDFNVPLGDNGKVDEDENWRILKSLSTIEYLQKSGAKIVLVSHIGRDKKETLKPIAEYLQKFIPVQFVPSLSPQEITEIVNNMQSGEIILLENIRQDSREEKNDPAFAAFLSSLADFYVNEAFSVSHREHASIVGVPLYLPSYAGFQFEKEIENLSKVMKSPEHPFLFILGGAKFDTKISLIKKFESIADNIFIGGALANNFFKKIGLEVGKSTVDEGVEVAEFFNKENISIPFDVVVDSGQKRELSMISKDEMIVDIGPETLDELKIKIKSAKMILWNGPLGFYEKGFDGSSKEIIKTISETGCFSIIGGGDTVKLVEDMGIQDKVSFVSTGGGAMLDFLATGTLPGIQSLENQI